MNKKLVYSMFIIFSVILIAKNVFADQRVDAMDKAMASIANEYVEDNSLSDVQKFVLNNAPKQMIDVETDNIDADRPLTKRELKKQEEYKRRKKKLNIGAYLKDKEIMKNIEARFNMSAGYRFDNVKWNIAGSGGYPDILSELDWRDQKSKQLTFKGDICFFDKYIVDASYSTGNIVEGACQDSDYLSSSRQDEYSRSYSETQGGDVYDLMIALGYKKDIEDERFLKMANCDELSVTGLVGYSNSEQDLVAEKGKQIIPLVASDTLYNNLHSKYVTEWKGPWFGFELSGRRRKLTGTFRYQYHLADYYAWADWNLRSDFQHPKSFEHEAKARGFKINVGTNYHLREDFTLDFGIDFSKFHTEPGVDRTFLSSGTVSETALNEVLWDSYAFMFGGTYYFK